MYLKVWNIPYWASKKIYELLPFALIWDNISIFFQVLPKQYHLEQNKNI